MTGSAVRTAALSQVLAGFEASFTGPDAEMTGMTLDSRKVAPGDLFVALSGTTSNGLDFVEHAIERGCAAILAEDLGELRGLYRERYIDVGFAELPDLRTQLGAITARFYAYPSRQLKVVGVTGTNGKTSCVQMLSQALTARGEKVGTIGTLGTGTVGNLLPELNTTPDVISVHRFLAGFVDAHCTAAAMEVSSHALDQGRVDNVQFEVAALTNLSRDHLDYHGTMAAYGDAKAKLFLEHRIGTAVVNTDDEFGARLLASLPQELARLSYGLTSADVVGRHVVTSAEGLQFELHTPWGTGVVESGLLGQFNVYNLLAVAACLGALGVPFGDMMAAITAIEPVPGRMQKLGTGPQPLVVIDYAHTPDALVQALRCLREHTNEKLICVFGCGGDRDKGKRPLMAAAAEANADLLIITDDNPRTEDGDAIVADILRGIGNRDRAVVIRDRRAAIAAGIERAGIRDAVLVAGKGHEDYQEINGVRESLSDIAYAQSILEQVAR